VVYLSHSLSVAVLVVGVGTLLIARTPYFRADFRRSTAITVVVVALLTVLLSLNVLLVGAQVRDATAALVPDQAPALNGLLLAGMLLLLVSSLAFFLALGVLMWTLVPDATKKRAPLGDGPGERAEQRINH
jgi:hypothetical protein